MKSIKKISSIVIGLALFLSTNLPVSDAYTYKIEPVGKDAINMQALNNATILSESSSVGYNGVTLGLYAIKDRIGAITFHLPKNMVKNKVQSTDKLRIFKSKTNSDAALIGGDRYKDLHLIRQDDKSTIKRYTALKLHQILPNSKVESTAYMFRNGSPAYYVSGQYNQQSDFMLVTTIYDESAYYLLYIFDPKSVTDMDQLQKIIISYDVRINGSNI